jgi:hypothetical protein
MSGFAVTSDDAGPSKVGILIGAASEFARTSTVAGVRGCDGVFIPALGVDGLEATAMPTSEPGVCHAVWIGGGRREQAVGVEVFSSDAVGVEVFSSDDDGESRREAGAEEGRTRRPEEATLIPISATYTLQGILSGGHGPFFRIIPA